MDVQYDNDAIVISRLAISGIRIDRVHGNSYRVEPRYYVVRDRNLCVRGAWVIELHTKQVEERNGAVHESTVVKVLLAPKTASKRMASLTRQSIMFQPGKEGRYRGLPYAHITFREPDVLGGKRTAGRGQKGALPSWFKRQYGRRTRLRVTVQGKVISYNVVGQRLSKYHDVKQVVVLDEWDDEEFIRLFFMMRVFSSEQGYVFEV